MRTGAEAVRPGDGDKTTADGREILVRAAVLDKVNQWSHS